MMSRYSFIRFATLTLACAGIGCGQDASFATLATVPAEELAQLPTDCGDLSTVADDDLMWSRAEGDDAAIVLDTPDGACVDRRERVLITLTQQHRDGLALIIQRAFERGDPAPHPDLPTGTVGKDPSPHPDKPQNTASGNPNPHPDKNSSDEKDNTYAVLIVTPIVIGNTPTGGDGTPPPPPPPAPTTGQVD